VSERGPPGGREEVDTGVKGVGEGSGWEGCSTLGRCSVVRTVLIEFLGLAPPAAWLLGGAMGRGTLEEERREGWGEGERCSTLGRCSVVRTVLIEFLGLAPPAAWLLGGAMGRGRGMGAFGLDRRALSRRLAVERGGQGVSTMGVLGEGRETGV